MSNFYYYVEPGVLGNLNKTSIRLSYTRNVCNNAIYCEDKGLFIIKVNEDMIEEDKLFHIKHYETLLDELLNHDEIAGLKAVYNRVKFYNPIIWFGKVFRNENLCDNKDIEYYESQTKKNK